MVSHADISTQGADTYRDINKFSFFYRRGIKHTYYTKLMFKPQKINTAVKQELLVALFDNHLPRASESVTLGSFSFDFEDNPFT